MSTLLPKLQLDKETLRRLSGDQAEGVAAGWGLPRSRRVSCPGSDACPEVPISAGCLSEGLNC